MSNQESIVKEIKGRVTVPDYFKNIIEPQTGGYYSDYRIDFDTSPVCKCPLHDEDTPSFRYYEETNTFYCWGCGGGGDIISLHREFTKRSTGVMPSFEESLDFLYEYFVKGKESKSLFSREQKQEEYKSSVRELMRLSGYCTKLDNQLLVDPSIPLDKKMAVWELIDMMNLFASTNTVNATEALEFLKGVVKNTIK